MSFDADEPKSCEKCGLTHVRCMAHTRDGRPCGQPRMRHQDVCRKHGGRSPQALAKAEQKQAEEDADVVLASIWPGLGDADPVTDPIRSLQRLAGALEQAVDDVGGRVNELRSVAGGANSTQLRAEVVLLERLLGQLRQALEGMARLGIEERQVQIQQAQAELILAAFRAGLGAVASQLLTPADRIAMETAFLVVLGVDPAELEAASA